MWRRYPDRDAEYWHRRQVEYQELLESRLNDIASPDPADRWMIYGILRDNIESIEICRNNIALIEGTGHYHDAAWVRGKLADAVARLDALMHAAETATDELDRRRLRGQIQGRRKLVRKWNEERVHQMTHERYHELLRAGEAEMAAILLAEWRNWMTRPDRKDFDGDAWVDEDVQAHIAAGRLI